MKTLLITGGAGFFGTVLLKRLLDEGHRCVSVDLYKHELAHASLIPVQGDIRDAAVLDRVLSGGRFDAIFHCAAILAHGERDENLLWSCNVDGTKKVAEAAKKHKVPRAVFTSSNCLWGENLKRPIAEDETPKPVELYGLSKLEGEKILRSYRDDFHAIIIRCPTIVDSGRLGLLTILFEFIDEGRTVWLVGKGQNKYQFIYARDLADAFVRSLDHGQSDTFHIGSDNVKSLRDVYQHVIEKSGSVSTIRHLPLGLAILAMKVAHGLKVSPLSPYHYKMIAEDFVFDTARIKRSLGWSPTLTNEQMLWAAYEYYTCNRKDIESRKHVSAHRKRASMGIIRLLKWIS